MKKKRIILPAILLLLAALAWWLWRSDRGSTLAAPLANFAVADTSKVTRIFVADLDGKTVDIVRGGSPTGWRVNDMDDARLSNVTLALKTFLRVEVRSPVPKSAEANVLRVMSATGKRVEIYEGGRKPSKIWYVGHATQDHFGTFMLLEIPGKGRSSVPFITGMSGFTGHLSSRFHTDLDEWRSTRLTAYDDVYRIAELAVEQPLSPAASFRIVNRGGDDLSMLDGAGRETTFDTVAVKDLLFRYLQLNFEAFERKLSPLGRDSLLASTPNWIVELKERDGRTHTWKYWLMPYTGEEPEQGPTPLHDPIRMHALVKDSMLVTVQRLSFDLTLPPADFLRP